MDVRPTSTAAGGQERLVRRGYSGLFAGDAHALARLDDLARGCIPAVPTEEWHVSSLIDEEDLVKCGYITAFPSQLTVAATVAPAAFETVVRARAVTVGDLAHQRKHLTPAACLNLYPMLGQQRRADDRAVTTLTSVFRHEEGGFQDLTRMWEFKVREIVFAGTQDFVRDMLDRTLVNALDLARRLELAPRVAGASDHFYPSRANAVRQKMQVQSAFKRELLVPVEGADLAVASFNYHATHFSGPFEFDDGNRIVTGCVGFGLARWLAATSTRVDMPPQPHVESGETTP
jgi:seryl-tRNA synthetase